MKKNSRYEHKDTIAAMNKTRKTFIGMMIVLSMGIFISLPQGIHIEICFGFDGHVDAAADRCITDFDKQTRQQAMDADGHHHHENCLDVVIGCTSWDFLHRITEKGSVPGTNTLCSDLSAPAGYTISGVRPVHFSCSYPDQNPIPTQSQLSRQTVVLLI